MMKDQLLMESGKSKEAVPGISIGQVIRLLRPMIVQIARDNPIMSNMIVSHSEM